MPAYYQSSLESFLSENPTNVLWKLAQANAAARFPLTPQAIEAWHAQLPVLIAGVADLVRTFPEARYGSILLEYPIPIVGKRIDAVLLVRNVIIVIETKTGSSVTSATRQAEDYSLNLAYFHEYSAGRRIVPLVVSDAPVASSAHLDSDNLIERSRLSSQQDLGAALEEICREYVRAEEDLMDSHQWNVGRFRPIPPIVDAAVALYAGMDVFEIEHACAARESLQQTTDALLNAVLSAREHREKIICFTTGVPGAGKTLVGLNAVHRPEIKNFSSFLSGNGPLVRVIQEALVRDVLRRSRAGPLRTTRHRAELEVQTFVHNVHRFADQFYGEGKREPAQNVVVFDEAQRAWDADENRRAKRPHVSEPQMMLEVMDRRQDWAVIIALIGGGQEIHRGEAGLAEWGRALAGFPNWKVLTSPLTISSNSPMGFRLFQDPDPYPARVSATESLHLTVSTRSIRAQRISDWVDAVLMGSSETAAELAMGMESRPVVSRNLDTIRAWLKGNRRGRTRAGLVSSSSAARLRVDGLEPSFDFHRRFDWEHWFLDTEECSEAECDHKYCNDVRASSTLEVAATQFEIQGLELDWVGVCWGEDLTWDDGQWSCRRFNNRQWKRLSNADERKQSYLINGYRVLLTRARQGMAIYVPSPEKQDKSRLHRALDSTAKFLLDCGAVPADA